MKRTRILAVLGVLLAVATMGCASETGTADATDESGIVSQRAHDFATGQDQIAATDEAPTQALELKSHTTSDGEGPHPEPWLDTANPHPEPWQQPISSQPDPNTPSSGDNNHKP